MRKAGPNSPLSMSVKCDSAEGPFWHSTVLAWATGLPVVQHHFCQVKVILYISVLFLVMHRHTS